MAYYLTLDKGGARRHTATLWAGRPVWGDGAQMWVKGAGQHEDDFFFVQGGAMLQATMLEGAKALGLKPGPRGIIRIKPPKLVIEAWPVCSGRKEAK